MIRMLQVSHPLRVVARWMRCRNYQPRTRNDCNAPHVCCNKGSFYANGSLTMACTAIIKSEQNIFQGIFFTVIFRYIININFHEQLFLMRILRSTSKGKFFIFFSSFFFFIRLMQMEVMSLEDVYWVEDNAARAALGKDLPRWTQARQTLPTSKEDLETLKADLWSAVVKNSQHQDAWTWGMILFHRFS